MIELPRREAGRFRAVVRRCVAGRPRAPSPPIHLRQKRDTLLLSVSFAEVTLSLRLKKASDESDAIAIPMEALEALVGNEEGTATLEAVSGERIRCRWSVRGAEREAFFASAGSSVPETDTAASLAPRLRSIDPSILAALHECGRTTDGSGGRYAFSRLQLCGKDGQIIGTDGRQLLVWNGFELPFAQSLLVPAVPVFGHRELATQSAVRIGRADDRILIEAGPWTVALKIDKDARFPKVDDLLARSVGGARLRLAESDAESLRQDLERLRDRADPNQAAALQILCEPGIVVASTRIPLAASVIGETEAIAGVAMPHLLRSLALGLRSIEADRAGSSVLFSDEHRSYLVACVSVDGDSVADSQAALPSGLGRESQEGGPVMPSSKNGHPESAADAEPPDEMLDPLTEAEELRAALAEAGRRATRLMGALRRLHKQRRVLQSAWSSLRQLGLGGRVKP